MTTILGPGSPKMGKIIDASFTGGRRDAPLEQALRICTGANSGDLYVAGLQDLVIGRSPSSDIRLNDDLVSQTHAKICGTRDGQHILKDLDSSNGTFVNNELIHSVTLKNGDFIQVGDTVMQYVATREGQPVEPETVRRGAIPPAIAEAAQMMMVRARHTDTGLPTAARNSNTLPVPFREHPLGPVLPPHPQPAPEAPASGANVGLGHEPELTFNDYLAMAKRTALFFLPHWKTIAAVVLVGALGGVASFYIKPPPKRAFFEMSLMPDARETRVNTFESGSVSFFTATEQNFRSLNLIQKTLEDLGNTNPSDEFVTAIQRFLEFQEVGDPYARTQTIMAGFSSKDGDFAVTFLKNHLENYLDTEIEKKLKVITVESDFLRTQATEAKAALDRAQQALLAFKERNIETLPDQARQYYELLFDLQRRQSDASKEIDSVKAALQLDRARLTREAPLVRSSVSTSRPYAQAIAEINGKIAAARAKGLADAHPDVVQLKKQLQELETLADKFNKTGGGDEIKSTNPEYQDIRSTLRRLEAQRELARSEATRVEADLRKVKGIVEAMPKIEAEYKDLSRDFESAQDLYKDLTDKMKATQLQVELERASVAARYDIITQPRLEYFSPKEFIRKRALMGAVAGLGLGLALVWLLELKRGNPLVLKPA